MSKEKVNVNTEVSSEKLLSGLVPAEIYWEFKKQAAERKESMREAICNAALLYIDVSHHTGTQAANSDSRTLDCNNMCMQPLDCSDVSVANNVQALGCSRIRLEDKTGNTNKLK